MAKNRAEVWRKYLLGDYETILQQRKMYHNIIIHHPYEIDPEISKIIKNDIPRTTLQHGHLALSDNRQKIIESLLVQYVQIMPCDGYLQGFNYIMALLYQVYEKEDVEHALSDTWWSMVSVVSVMRPMIPDHDPHDFQRYTNRWSIYYKNHLRLKNSRLFILLEPHFSMILPMITVKWLMIWFTQLFALEDIKIVWDALITCDSKHRTKLMAIIAANITIQQGHAIETWARECPSEVGGRLWQCRASDATVIIEQSRLSMIQYKIPVL